MRKLATIRRVTDVRPIPDADRIEVALVDGWEVVIKKGEFKPGDLCVYIEIDSVVPQTEYFEFMAPRKYRVRTIKIRGQVSQGLVVPIQDVLGSNVYKVGDDVTEALGIKKYDPELAKEMRLKSDGRIPWYKRLFGHGKQKTARRPEFIIKTDEERIQNLPRLFEKLRDEKIPLHVTEKLDGTSATYAVKKRRFGYDFYVCSRNLWLCAEDNSCYWEIARKHDVKRRLVQYAKSFHFDTLVVQGEIIGPGIQKNRYKLDDYAFYVFNMYEDSIFRNNMSIWLAVRDYLPPFMCVPWIDGDYNVPETIHDLVEYAKGKSQLNLTVNREGLVMRNHMRNISFKVINPDYLLKEDADE